MWYLLACDLSINFWFCNIVQFCCKDKKRFWRPSSHSRSQPQHFALGWPPWTQHNINKLSIIVWWNFVEKRHCCLRLCLRSCPWFTHLNCFIKILIVTSTPLPVYTWAWQQAVMEIFCKICNKVPWWTVKMLNGSYSCCQLKVGSWCHSFLPCTDSTECKMLTESGLADISFKKPI